MDAIPLCCCIRLKFIFINMQCYATAKSASLLMIFGWLSFGTIISNGALHSFIVFLWCICVSTSSEHMPRSGVRWVVGYAYVDNTK